MSRVRIEIWDNADNLRSAEVEHPDSRIAYERAASMAEATLPPKKPEGVPGLRPSSYTFEMKNVQLTDVNNHLLFVDAEGRKRAQTFDAKVVSDEPLRKPCEAPCPSLHGRDEGGDPCGDRCARPVGHEGQHTTADRYCSWDRRTFQNKPEEQCRMICDKSNPDCWANCHRPKGHDGNCWCSSAHNTNLCLNDVGSPGEVRSCHQPQGHEGFCDGEQDALIDGMRD